MFREAFAAAGLPYHNPRSFRNTLACVGLKLCGSHEDLKAWSQNLGHEQMLTTLTSYGTIDLHRQAELIQKLGMPNDVDVGLREQILSLLYK